ncbi:MAG: Ig-like domain-containing protein, partial [Candidatus Krumholzibacteria bacterium]|nr:Ig-like domain-containing protein [Candidatus Krumholzibacteria bacterium]
MKRSALNSMRYGALAAGLGAFMLFAGVPVFAAGGSGTAAISPSSDVSAGGLGTWTIRYTAAEAFSSGTIALAVPDGWSAPQISTPSSAGYVTVSSEGVLGAPALAIAGRTITVSVDTLDAGQTIDIVYGDPSMDVGGRAAAQTGAQSGVEFVVRSDPDGSGDSPIAASPLLDVVAGPVARLSFITSPRTFPADGESAVIRVRTEDQFGNPAAVGGDQDISLSSTAPGGRFSRLGGSSFVETSVVVLASGLDTVSLYYRDTLVGGKTIAATASGQSWTIAQQAVTVDPGTPFRLVVSPSDTTVIAGDYVRYRLGVEDVEGNASPLPNDQEISLLGQPGDFYVTTDHATPIASIVIANGSDHAFLDYRNIDKEMASPLVLAFLDTNGAPPTLEAASALIYIDNAPLSAVTSGISVNSASAIANAVDTIEIIVRAYDVFYNGIEGAAVLIASTGSGNLLHQPVGGTSGTGSAVGSIASAKAEGKTLTAKINGIDIAASVDVTFVPGPFDPAVSDVSVDKTSAVANGIDSIAVTALVTDAEGNPIVGSFVTFEATGTLNTITPSSGVTGMDGRLVGKLRSTKAEG